MIAKFVKWSVALLLAFVLLFFVYMSWVGRDQEIAVVPLTESHQVRIVVRDVWDDFPDVFAVLEMNGREITRAELIVGISTLDRIDDQFAVRRTTDEVFEVVESLHPKKIIWLRANVASGTIEPTIGRN